MYFDLAFKSTMHKMTLGQLLFGGGDTAYAEGQI